MSSYLLDTPIISALLSQAPIGFNDLLIGAHTYAFGMTLVTGNTRELGRIRSLAVGNTLV